MTTIQLSGCTTEPFGSYLKSLAILRLVCEQVERGARGFWGPSCFHLQSSFNEEALVNFFLNDYRPTPIVTPWNAGSGFQSEKGRAVVDVIANSTIERLVVYREAISRVRAMPLVVPTAKKASPREEDLRRSGILRACRNMLPDQSVEWLDAAMVISAQGNRAPAPILGTGGNEGNLEYSNHFMKYVGLMFVVPESSDRVMALLHNALFGQETDQLEPSSVGQFDPGRAGGKNQGPTRMTEKVPSNPWNFILTLEGTVAWASGLYRKHATNQKTIFCSPFTVRSAMVGYESAAAGEANRAEIWTPLWTRPARYAELRNLLREGRSTLDDRPAQTGLEFAQAASTLGVDRGITAFVRYNLAERRGQGYYVALPAGRFPVAYRTESDHVRELMPILDRADSFLKKPPASYTTLRRSVDEAIYDLLLHGGPDGLTDVARAFGMLVRWILTVGTKVKLIGSLSSSWVEALSTIPEARIAGAIAGLWDKDAGSFREHLDRNSRKFAWAGGTLPQRLIRVLERRMMEGAADHNPFRSRYSTPVTDATLFVDHDVDDELVEDLLFAFAVVNWNRGSVSSVRRDAEIEPWPVYSLMKHLFLPEAIKTPSGPVVLRADARVIARLSAGDVSGAAEIARRRLQVAGLAPVDAEFGGGVDAERLAAALLIPVPYGPALRIAVLSH